MSRKEAILNFVLEHQTLIKYLIAGGYNTVFGFLVFTGLYLLFEDQFHYLIIAFMTQIIAITNSFLVYRYLVFKSEGNLLLEYLKIYVVYSFSLVLSIVLMALLVELLDLHPILAQLIVIIVGVAVSYVGHRRFTFSENPGD